jgi:hypothetical protein
MLRIAPAAQQDEQTRPEAGNGITRGAILICIRGTQ